MSDKRPVTAEDLYRFTVITDNQLSPDGTRVVFSVQRVDDKSEKKYSNLWLVPTDASAPPRQLTFGDQSDSMPRWSPDGQTLAFVSNRGDKAGMLAQVYLLPMAGGEARPVTDLKGMFLGLDWSPDGSTLLLTFRKADPEVLAREADPKAKELGVVARHYTRNWYKFDGAGFMPHEQTHLWTLATDGDSEPVQLTDHKLYSEDGAIWSPDGQWIYFTANRTDNPDMDLTRNAIFRIPAAGGAIETVRDHGPAVGALRFSPDGQWLSMVGNRDAAEGWQNDDLWVMPAAGGDARNLTRDTDLHVGANSMNDLGGDAFSTPQWTADGSEIVFEVSHHGRTRLMAVNVATGALRPVIDRDGVVIRWQLSRATGIIAYQFGTMTDIGQLFATTLAGDTHTRLTTQNAELMAELDLGTVEEVWLDSADGAARLHGWIMRPPGNQPGQQHPAILEIHGGPLMQYSAFFMHEFYYLAAQGYVVGFSNPRGSRGYGEAHARAIWGTMADPAHDDLMTFADHLAAQPYVDAERMGVTGGSYGGYMTLWIVGHTPRFKAAVAQRVVSNWIDMWGASDMSWYFQHWVGNQPPWDNIETYWKWSPMAYMGNVVTPTMIIHSEMDLRCPISQGEQAYTALQYMRVPSELVRFPGEPHGLSRIGRTDRRIVRLNHILRWMDTWLQPEKLAAAAEAEPEAETA